MAVDQKAYSPHLFRLAIAKQASWDTAITDQAVFRELHLTNRPEIKSAVVEDFTRRATGSIVASKVDHYRTTAGGEFTIPIEGVATLNTISPLLYAVCQVVPSEGASTPYPRVWTLGQSITVPTVPNFYFTTLIYDPSGENRALKNCVIKNLTLTFSPGSGGGRVTYSGTIYSGTAPTTSGVTATPSSWIAPDTTYYGISGLDTATLDIGALGTNDLVLFGWSLTVDNMAKRFGFNADGDAQGIAIGAGTAGIQVTGEVTAKYDDSTEKIEGGFLAGSTATLTIAYNASSSSDFNFVLVGEINEPTKDFGNEAGVGVTIPIVGVYDGSTAALVITTEDAINHDWVA